MTIRSRLPVWYPSGAGGGWLNYLVWCGVNQRTVEEPLPHFRYEFVKRHCPEFSTLLEYLPQNANLVARSSSAIILGNNHAWINFWILVSSKYDNTLGDTWIPHATALYRPQSNIVFNLDWCDIFQDPERFLSTLTRLSGITLLYNQHTRRAIEQYRMSCPHLDMPRSKLIMTDLVQTYIRENNITLEQAHDLLWTEKK